MLQNAAGLNQAKDVHENSPFAYRRVGEGTAGVREEPLVSRFGSTASSTVRPRGQDDSLGRGRDLT